MGCGAPVNQQTVATVPLQSQIKSEIIKRSSPAKASLVNKSNIELTKKANNKNNQINKKQGKSKLQNIRSSTKSMNNQEKKFIRTDSKSIAQSFQRKMSLNPSKINFNVQQVQKVNEQQAQNMNVSQKKKRKANRKKAEMDSRINELIKIYAL